VLASVFGRRKDVVFKDLKALLESFNISHYYTDDWGAYERHLASEKHETGKTNTQKIEHKNHTIERGLNAWRVKQSAFPCSKKCMIL
jgi:IS1 family transposase